MRELLIFDLDDTIFETKSIREKSINLILNTFKNSLTYKFGKEITKQIVSDLWKFPFDFVAQKYQFNNSLHSEFTNLINEHEYKLNIQPYEDFEIVRNLKQKKILVTSAWS